jgi:hypothetical protein
MDGWGSFGRGLAPRLAQAVLALALSLAGCAPAPSTPVLDAERNAIPLLVYYYIWFDPRMWGRAKLDYPLLGRYSSDDREVMQQHVKWAKQAGIDGFIISWKSTEKLNRRLEQLMQIAGEEGLKLAIIYQGLDVERQPLPIDRIASDLDLFRERYAQDPVFDLFGRPLVIWSGTWEFLPEEVAQVVNPHREHLLILASERNLQGYERLRYLVDGNAYYWSSVNPETFPGYPEKLEEMGRAAHADGGLWIAPAAPGFDARLAGGTRVVERNNGETLRRQMEAALRSSPDAIGLISWNEFSENTHIEPSEKYRTRYVELVAGMRLGMVPDIINFESSEPAETQTAPDRSRALALAAMALLIVSSLAAIALRRRTA